MAVLVSIINGKAPSGGSGGVSDADLANLAVNFLNQGAVGSTDLQVQPQSTPNNTLKVKAGKYYVLNPAGTMMYLVTVTADFTPVTVPNNPSGTNPQIDAVVLKIDTVTTPDNTASNVASFVVVQGTPAVSPSAPLDSAIQTAVGGSNAFARLGEINVVAGFTSAMSITSVTDKRTRSYLKPGIVTTSTSFSYSLNAAQVSSFTSALASGSSGNGVYDMQGVVDLTALGIPSTATILSYEIWIHGAGNLSQTGYARCAVPSITANSAAFKAQLAGNDGGTFPNLTNSKIEGYVRYIA